MKMLKPIAVTALSFAFMTAGALAQTAESTQTTQSTTQSTSSTDAYGNTQTQVKRKAHRSAQTMMPDGTTVTTQHESKTSNVDANGQPVTNEHSTKTSQDTTSPDGTTQTHVETQTHTETGSAPPPQL